MIMKSLNWRRSNGNENMFLPSRPRSMGRVHTSTHESPPPVNWTVNGKTTMEVFGIQSAVSDPRTFRTRSVGSPTEILGRTDVHNRLIRVFVRKNNLEIYNEWNDRVRNATPVCRQKTVRLGWRPNRTVWPTTDNLKASRFSTSAGKLNYRLLKSPQSQELFLTQPKS